MTSKTTDRNHDDLRSFGATPTEDGETLFRVWAVDADQVVVDILDGPQEVAMTKDSSGFHQVFIPGVHSGAKYFYRLDGGPQRPDPASRFQCDGVHGPSQVIDKDFEWTDADWTGPQREDLVIYEMHVGAFTDQGTFLAAIERLEELVDLGVTAIELMPVAASAGRWNWGYDGVALFAPSEAYGTPDDFRRFVDAAHAAGLSVFLDVVYNHLGPEGNYLHDFGPYLSSKHNTVWGDAPNFDHPKHGPIVREFFVANALHWIEEYHLDGLRVDAIHCMIDERDPHVVYEISEAVRDWSERNGRSVMMIAESNVYDPEMTKPLDQGGVGFDAMWCDDFLHSTFSVLRPGEQLSHRTYHPGADLERTLRYGYVYEGTLRNQRGRNEIDQRVETTPLVYSIQNHDFIGNHPLGKRLHQLTGDDAHRAAAALMMMMPAIPMLFMGEEFACDHPFRFFVDFSDPQLQQSVVEGRRREYPQHDWSDGILPTEPEAFSAAKIGAAADGNSMTREWYKALIDLRKQARTTGLLSDAHLTVATDPKNGVYQLQYQSTDDALQILVRLTSTTSENETSINGSIPFDTQVSFGEGKIILDSRPQESQGRHLLANHAVILR